MSRKLEFIVLAVLSIFVAQFIYISSNTHAEYGGAEDKLAGVIEQITGGIYKPIEKPIWEPPSAEIENLLFALQAAIGAGVIGTSLAITEPKATMKKI
jgi:cobalt/nickel transport protein